NRNAFGDADDERNARIGGFHNGVGCERRRDEDNGRVGAGVFDGFGYSIENGAFQVIAAAFAWRDAADNRGAVGDGLLGVEGAFLAGETLNEQARVFVDEYAHALAPEVAALARATTFSAASFMPSAT